MWCCRGKAKADDEIHGAYLKRQRMITKDGWKLNIDVFRLYNLKADPPEINDPLKLDR